MIKKQFVIIHELTFMINKYLSNKLKNLSYKLDSLSQKFYIDPLEKASKEWHKKSGDTSLRLDYDNLNKNSIVFDLGGYRGQWSSDLYSKYSCKVYIFEPVNAYYTSIKKRFKNNPDIKIFNYGLARNTTKLKIQIAEASSSMFSHKNTESIEEEVTLFSFSEFLKENNISNIDLIKINIEGAEYDLLNHLIEDGIINKILNIQVQFHNFVPNHKKLRTQIHDELKKTHSPTYIVDYIWENWIKK